MESQDNQLHQVEFKESVVLPKVEPAPQKNMNSKSQIKSLFIVGLFALMIVSGTGVGFALAQMMPQKSVTKNESATLGEEEFSQINVLYGSDDAKKFPDSVEGVLVAGGLDGEGTHHILRQGGKTQTVYVTSSFLDLDQFIDHKITAWGETFSAQKASWLMDVGGVKIIEKNAEKPFEEETKAVVED